MMPPSLLESEDKEKAYHKAMSEPGGFERLTIKSFVKQDEMCKAVTGLTRTVGDISDKLDTNTKEDKDHRNEPAHTAHKFTRETWIYIAAGLLTLVLGASAAASQLAPYLPSGGS